MTRREGPLARSEASTRGGNRRRQDPPPTQRAGGTEGRRRQDPPPTQRAGRPLGGPETGTGEALFAALVEYGSKMVTTELIDRVLVDAPHIAKILEEAHQAAWGVTDPVMLELCRVRVARLLGNESELSSDLDPALVAATHEWPPSPLLSASQRACLAFTEEFVIDVANLHDETAAAVVSELGDQGFADFVNALLVIEQRQRMRLIWTRLFPEVLS